MHTRVATARRVPCVQMTVHIAKNYMELPKIKVPLILGIWGGKGQGKTFQCMLAYKKLGINPLVMSAGAGPLALTIALFTCSRACHVCQCARLSACYRVASQPVPLLDGLSVKQAHLACQLSTSLYTMSKPTVPLTPLRARRRPGVRHVGRARAPRALALPRGRRLHVSCNWFCFHIAIRCAGELESGTSGEPARLVRQRYREAADYIKKGEMSSLFINDLDAGAGRMGSMTQYTVNNQMVNATLMNIADNPNNVQLPGVYKNDPIHRVPIIATGARASALFHIASAFISVPETSCRYMTLRFDFCLLSPFGSPLVLDKRSVPDLPGAGAGGGA
jgi:hypothetical protein